MTTDEAAALAIALMGIAALATRAGGAVLMIHVTPSRRVDRFLEGLAVSVIAALVANGIAAGGAETLPAVGLAVLVMVLTRSASWAMLAGMVGAIAWRAAVST